MQVPKRHADNKVAVLVEELEQLDVLLGLLLWLDLFRQAILVRVVLREFVAVLAVVGPPPTPCNDIDIQLEDDFDIQLPKLVELVEPSTLPSSKCPCIP